MTVRWIEAECPTGHDFDIFPDQPDFGGPDKVIRCISCGREHKLGDIGQMYEVVEDKVSFLTQDQWRAAINEVRGQP